MISRRELFGFFSKLGAAAALGGLASTIPMQATAETVALPEAAPPTGWTPFGIFQEALFREVEPEVYDAWFTALEFESYDDNVLTVSVPVRFIKKWVDHHYPAELLRAARGGYGSSLKYVDVMVRRYYRNEKHSVLSA